MILTIFLIKSNTQIDLVIPIMSLFVISIVRLIPAYNSFMQSLSAARHYKYSFEIYSGISSEKCENLLKGFFKKLR